VRLIREHQLHEHHRTQDPDKLDRRRRDHPARRRALDRGTHPIKTGQQRDQPNRNRDQHNDRDPAPDQLVPDVPITRSVAGLLRRRHQRLAAPTDVRPSITITT
jgi:hypothetical protein